MQVTSVQESKKGNNYVPKVLKTTPKVVTRANLIFSAGGRSLKLGRYNRPRGNVSEESPRSELSLDHIELDGLVELLKDNYNLVLYERGDYIKASDELNPSLVEKLRGIFRSKNKDEVVDFFLRNDFLPQDFENLLESKRRQEAIVEFEEKLNNNEVEYSWQTWFTENEWVLGGNFAEIIDERQINTQNIADYLVQDFDGFVDLIEIKRPEGGLSFWCPERDHGNLIPHGDLVKAITQSQAYILELEKEINSIATRDRLSGASIVRPRATLIFGRSIDWRQGERQAFRVLNTGYNNLTILTYEHVLNRAKRMTGESIANGGATNQ